MWKAAGILLFLFFIAPVKAGVILRAGGGPLRGWIGVMVWGLRVQFSFEMREGKPVFFFRGQEALRTQTDGSHPKAQAKRLLLQALRSAQARGLIRFSWTEIRLDLSFSDAASAALLTGLLRLLSGLAPSLPLRVFPVWRGQSALYARCIAQGRMGTLWSAYVQARRAAQKKEDQPWSIPSAT